MAELGRKLDFVLMTLNLEHKDSGAPAAYPEVEELVQKGRKMEAIQACQLATGAALNDARAAEEEMAKKLGK